MAQGKGEGQVGNQASTFLNTLSLVVQCNWTFQSQFFFSITLIQCVYKFAHVAYHSPMTLYHIFNLLCLPLSLTTTTSPQFNTD